jgi:glycosyltransferase involved in cell wall biosynthesis
VYAVEGVRGATWRSGLQPTVFYAKNYGPAIVFLALRAVGFDIEVVFEAHVLPRHRLQRLVLRHASLVVANTHALASDLVSRHRLERSSVLGTHQGVDLEQITAERTSSAEARRRLGLPQDKRLIVYTGKIFHGYKEIDYILEAARQLRGDSSIQFVLVGGRADHVEALKQEADLDGATNVVFVGFVPPTLVPRYQLAADVLLLYYPSGLDVNDYRSPGKLFEYLAAGRPIISVDLPVLREVLGQDPAAILVPQDAPLELARAIAELVVNDSQARELARRGLELARGFSWTKRAETIAEAIEQRIAPS